MVNLSKSAHFDKGVELQSADTEIFFEELKISAAEFQLRSIFFLLLISIIFHSWIYQQETLVLFLHPLSADLDLNYTKSSQRGRENEY